MGNRSVIQMICTRSAKLLYEIIILGHLKNYLASTATITTVINHSPKFYPGSSKADWSTSKGLLYITSALFLLLTNAPHHTQLWCVEVDELRQPPRMKQYTEVLSAPFQAFSLPCLVGEEGTYVPLVTAALYVCATSGRSWDADSRISLAGSMLPSSLPSRERLAAEVIC